MELSKYLTNIADAIRNKKGSSEKISAQDFPDEIKSIVSESNMTSEFISDSVSPDTGAIVFSSTMSQMSEIKYLLIYTMYTNSTSSLRMNAWATYRDGKIETVNGNSYLTVNGNSFTYTCNCSRLDDISPTIRCLVVGEV